MKSSSYRGATPNRNGRLGWKSQIWAGRNHFIGAAATEEQAAKDWDNAAHYLNQCNRGFRFALNFREDYSQAYACPAPSARTQEIVAWVESNVPEATAEPALQPFAVPGAVLAAISRAEVAVSTCFATIEAARRELQAARKGMQPEALEREKRRAQIVEHLGKLPAAAPQREIFQKMLDDLDKEA